MPHIYDKFAPHYEKKLRYAEKWFLSSWRQRLFAELPKNGRILELGAGTCENFEYLKDSDGFYATEISIEMLKIASNKTARPHLIQCDAQSLPFTDQSFDAVFCTLVFCSIPDPRRALQEISRVLKPSGVFFALEHVRPKGILGPVFDAINLLTVPLIEDHFNRKTTELIESSGLSINSVEEKAFGIVNLIKSCKTQDNQTF